MATRIEDAETALAAPGSNIEAWTVDDIKKSDILVFREDSTQYVDTVIAPNGFQVGLLDEAFLTDLLVTGDINGSGRVFSELGFSGSLTKLVDGSDYLIAGTGITLTTNSNGSITIESLGGGGTGGNRIKIVEEQTVNAGDPYTIENLFFGNYGYDFNQIDVFSNGELLKSGTVNEVAIGDADYYLNPDNVLGGEIVFGFNVTTADTITAIAGSGGGGTGSEYFAGNALELSNNIFNVKTDNQTIIVNQAGELELGTLNGNLTEGNGINNFLYNGQNDVQISIKPVVGSPITVDVNGVGLDIDNRTAISIQPTDEILISDGNIIGKTSIADIVNLVETDVAGAPADASYLVVSNTTNLSNERSLIMGDGLLSQDFGSNNSYQITVALESNGGLQFVSGKLAVKVADFAGFGLRDDGNNKLEVNTLEFAGTGLKLDTDGKSLAVDFGSNSGQVANGDNLVTITAGDGLNGGGEFLLGETNPTINLEVSAVSIAGEGLIAVDNNLTLDPDYIVNPDNDISITTGPGLTGDNIFNIGDPNIAWNLGLDISGSNGISIIEQGNTIIIDGLNVSGSMESFEFGAGLQLNNNTASVDFGSGSTQVPQGSNTLELQSGFGLQGGDTFTIGESKTIQLNVDAIGTGGITVSSGNNGQMVIDASGVATGPEYIFDEGFDQNGIEIDLDWGNQSTQVPRGSNTLTIDTEIGLKGGDVFTIGDSKVINLSVDAAGAGGINVYADLDGKLIIDGSGLSGGGGSYTFIDGITESNGVVSLEYGSGSNQVAEGNTQLNVTTSAGLTGDANLLIGEDNTINLGLDISGSNGIQTAVSGNTVVITGADIIGSGGIVVNQQNDGSFVVDGSNLSGSGGVAYTFTNGVYETNGVVQTDFGSGVNQVARGDTSLEVNTGIGLTGDDLFVIGEDNTINLGLDIRGEGGINVTNDGNTLVVSGQSELSSGDGIYIDNTQATSSVNIEYDGINNIIEKAIDGTNINIDENADRLLILDHNTQTVKKIAPSQLPGQEEALKTTIIKDSSGSVQGVITALDTNEVLTFKAGQNIQLDITPQDEIIITANAISGSGGDTLWLNPAPDNLTTTSSVGLMGGYGEALLPSDVAPDAYFYVSGSTDDKAVFGGDTRIEGELVSKFGVNIGENTDLDKGYIENITEDTRVSDLLTQMNQLLDAMAPPPAEVLSTINKVYGSGSEGFLSFGISQPILGVSYHTNIGFPSQIDINGLFSDDLTSNNNVRVGCFGVGTQYIGGQLASNIETNEMHNGLLNYPSGSFQKADEGLLILELNGNIIHQIDLSTTNGAGLPGFGTGIEVNANGSGFVNLSQIDYPKFHSGLSSTKHCHRTGDWKVNRSDWRKGHNYLRIAHYFDNSYHLTNFIEWIYMDNELPIEVRNQQLLNYSLTGSKFISGIEYYTTGSYQYNCIVDNMYNYIYPSYHDAVSFETPNAETLSIEIDNNLINDWKSNVPAIDTNETEVKSIEIGGNINIAADNWLVNEGVTSGINLKHPLKPEIYNEYNLTTHSMLLWFDNYQSTNTEENFGNEDFRVNDSDLLLQSDILLERWDSTENLESGSSLIVLDGQLIAPRNCSVDGNFKSTVEGGLIHFSPSGNPDYTYVSGSLTYLRNFENNTNSTMFNFEIEFDGNGSLVPSNITLNENNFHAYIKLPKSSITNDQTGWLDLGANFITNRYTDGSGALRYSLNSELPCKNKYTMGINGCGVSDSVIIKIVALDSWEGNLSSLKINWDTKYYGVNI